MEYFYSLSNAQKQITDLEQQLKSLKESHETQSATATVEQGMPSLQSDVIEVSHFHISIFPSLSKHSLKLFYFILF